jgi:folylpolyglutamate synthase/dihydropteroate synthase
MPKWPIWGGERPVEGAGIAELEAGAALAVERHIDNKQFAVLALVQLAHHDGHVGLCRLASASRCLPPSSQPVQGGKAGISVATSHGMPRHVRNERLRTKGILSKCPGRCARLVPCPGLIFGVAHLPLPVRFLHQVIANTATRARTSLPARAWLAARKWLAGIGFRRIRR